MTLLQSSLFWLFFAVLALLTGAAFPGNFKTSEDDKSVFPLTLILLTSAIILGALLRFSHLDFGFPEMYHPDEFRKGRILRSMSEAASWNPKYFLHPSLLLYLTKILARLFYSLNIYPENIVLRSVLAGRFVSALAGVGSICVSYLIVKQLFKSALLASVAAVLVATCPLAVDCSRYFKEDSLFTFFLLLVFLVSLMSQTKPKLVYLAGLLSGVCAGSKYTGLVAIFFPLASLYMPPILESQRFLTLSRFKTAFFICLAAVVGFIITTPYALITPGTLIAGINSEKNHALTGHGGISISAWSRLFTYHLSRSLFPGLTMPVLFVSLLGIGKLLKVRSFNTLFLLAGVVGFYLAAELVKSKPMPQPDRYALPAAIFFIYASIFFISQLSSTILSTLTALILIGTSVFYGVKSTQAISPDTRDLMAEWIVEKIPHNHRFVLVGLPNYAPHLTRFGYKMVAISPENGRNHTTIEALKKANYDFLLVTSLSYDRFFKEPEADQTLKNRFIEYDTNLELVKEVHSPYGSQGFHNPDLRLYRLK